MIWLSLALKVLFLLNPFLVCDYFIVDVDCVEVTNDVEVICLVVPADSATPQLAAAQRFYRLSRSTRVCTHPAFLAALAARKLRSPDLPPAVIRYVKGSSLRDVDGLV